MRKWWLLIVVMVLVFTLAACQSSEKTSEEDGITNSSVTVVEKDEELENAKAMFQPLGELVIPTDNEMTEEKIELGKQLYFDSRLSGDNKQSCMSCHSPGAGYGDGLKTFSGFQGHVGSRNSPTIINAAYYKEYFWDGRAGSLEEQALGPIQSEVEMNQDLIELVEELNAVPQYVEDFQSVFEDKISAENIAKAIAAFERTLTISDTAFDRYLAGDDDAISADAKEGMKLFVGKASCITCHAGPALSDGLYHNLGAEGDEGRLAVTDDEADLGAFRTPQLRGLEHTAPYMHDGSLATIEDVVDYYNEGGGTHTNKSALIKELNLTEKESKQLVEFLKSMSGDSPVVEAPTIY